jgi:hypothetical protein
MLRGWAPLLYALGKFVSVSSETLHATPSSLPLCATHISYTYIITVLAILNEVSIFLFSVAVQNTNSRRAFVRRSDYAKISHLASHLGAAPEKEVDFYTHVMAFHFIVLFHSSIETSQFENRRPPLPARSGQLINRRKTAQQTASTTRLTQCPRP